MTTTVLPSRTRRSRSAADCTRRGSARRRDRKSTRLNSSHSQISYAVFCLKKKKNFDALSGHGQARGVASSEGPARPEGAGGREAYACGPKCSESAVVSVEPQH